MAEKEVDLLGDAIAGTEAEIFGEAVNGVETDVEVEEQPDKSLEEMEEAPGAEAADESEEEGEAEGDESEADQGRDKKTGQFTTKDDASDKGEKTEAGDKPEAGEQGERKGNPAVPLAAERKRAKSLEDDLAKERSDRAAERDSFKQEFAKLEGRLDQILRTQPQQQPAKTDETQKTKPDIFTDPDGYDKWQAEQRSQAVTEVEQKLTERFINSSMADAHEKHGKAFETAFQAASSLDRSNPASSAVLRTIREAPNPGAALMRWHQQQETLREVGPDPQAYVSRKVEEALAAKMKDPEFRKQMFADMQAEARGGSAPNSGRPRNIIRQPASLNGAAGRGEQQLDPRVYDNSEGAVFESAFGD